VVVYLQSATCEENTMALDRDEFEALLDQARAHAELAVSQADPLHYRDAFEASLKAMRLLAEESGAWRQMVARATEEFEGDEGV
jgi:hypothetical protein